MAAKREAMEEVGVDVKLVGTLEWKVYEAPIHNPNHGGNGGSGSAAAAQRLYRRFVTFYAEPADPDSCAPKTVPDFESVGACWVSVEELTLVPLRTSLPLKWFRYVAKGGVIHPLAIPDELAHAFESLPLF